MIDVGANVGINHHHLFRWKAPHHQYRHGGTMVNTTTALWREGGLARLYRVNPGEDVIDWPLVMAASTITILPVLLGFVLVERHLVRGITMGAVK